MFFINSFWYVSVKYTCESVVRIHGLFCLHSNSIFLDLHPFANEIGHFKIELHAIYDLSITDNEKGIRT